MRVIALLTVFALPVLAQEDGGVMFVEDSRLVLGDAGIKLEGLMTEAHQVRSGEVLTPQANWLSTGEGCFLPTQKCITAGKETARLQAENEELKKKPKGIEPIISAAWVGFAAGVVTTLVGVGTVCQVTSGNPLCLQR